MQASASWPRGDVGKGARRHAVAACNYFAYGQHRIEVDVPSDRTQPCCHDALHVQECNRGRLQNLKTYEPRLSYWDGLVGLQSPCYILIWAQILRPSSLCWYLRYLARRSQMPLFGYNILGPDTSISWYTVPMNIPIGLGRLPALLHPKPFWRSSGYRFRPLQSVSLLRCALKHKSLLVYGI